MWAILLVLVRFIEGLVSTIFTYGKLNKQLFSFFKGKILQSERGVQSSDKSNKNVYSESNLLTHTSSMMMLSSCGMSEVSSNSSPNSTTHNVSSPGVVIRG